MDRLGVICVEEFKVGDIVVGNEMADGQYTKTRTGVVCRVVEVHRNGYGTASIRVQIINGDGPFTVEPEYFTHTLLITPEEDDDFTSFIFAYGGAIV